MASHTATGEWQSFEVRMRRRRAERLVLRADVAVDAECFDDARASLEEARALWSGAPGLDDVARRIDLATAALQQTHRSRRKEFAAALVAFVCIACAAAVIVLAHRRAPVAADDQRNVAAADSATPSTGDPSGPSPSSPIEPAPVESAPLESAPAESPIQPTLPDPSPTRSATHEPARPVTIASRTTEPAPRQSQMRDAAVQPRPSQPTSLPPISLAPITPAAGLPAAIPAMVATTTATLPIETERVSVQPPPETLVRGALARYERAYSDLDVDAAGRVWPTVNRSALSRAFESLSAQRVSLGDCRIQVDGGTARASCAGTASWTPKVGGHEHVDARSWNFDLEKASTDWQIVGARVQNR